MGGVSMEWKEVRLGDVCSKIGSGATPSGGKEAYKGGDYHLIRSQNVLDFAFSKDGLASINDEQANKLKNVEIIQGDVLLNITGDSVARCCIVPSEILPARVNQHVAIIRPRKEELDNHYLLYYLQYYKRQLLQIASAGATRNAITKAMIENLILPCPKSLDDQRRIASILSSLDRKIELNNKINADLEEMAQAIFKNWFVDFEPFKDGKFVNSELGMIPEGWKVGRLADIAEITMGQSPAGNSLNENREGMIFYQGSSDFGFRFPSIRVFTTEPKRLAVANSVLFSVRAPVGDINVAKEECCIGRGVASIKSKYGHDSYLFYTMKSLHKLFDSFDGEGTVFGSINKKTLSAIQILLPSDGIVEQFNNIASSFDDRIRSLSDENSRLSLLRDTLLPRLMSGELEVPE